MGAQEFYTTAMGANAQEAFDAAVEQAQYDHGHSGYSGSVAEKTEFVEIEVPEGRDPLEFAEALVDNDDRRIRDKWGPAGCVEVSLHGGGQREYLFFGWASM
jgi:hypothetical protein